MFGHCISPLTGRASLMALVCCVALASLARADEKVAGEVLVILAKEAAGEVDPKLKQLPALQKPPFNGFKSMKVLSTIAVELTAGNNAAVEMPNGSKLSLSLVERMPDGRHKVDVTISRPGKQPKQMTVIAAGEPFFVAGQSHEGGTLVVGVRIGSAAKK